MSTKPTLKTERLILRPFSLDDARDVQRLAGEKDIAKTTLTIPHPYEDGKAEEWIGTHQKDFVGGTQVVFAIVKQKENELIGAIGLSSIKKEFENAELGYWIGKEFWGKGYCTEAARAVLKYGFDELGLNRIHSHHFGSNPASGKIMQKVGMTYEGTMRQHIKKWDKFEDAVCFGILKSEFLNGTDFE
jgi:[ribosomal protein S5]-alanine N-acetyltransferase